MGKSLSYREVLATQLSVSGTLDFSSSESGAPVGSVFRAEGSSGLCGSQLSLRAECGL